MSHNTQPTNELITVEEELAEVEVLAEVASVTDVVRR